MVPGMRGAELYQVCLHSKIRGRLRNWGLKREALQTPISHRYALFLLISKFLIGGLCENWCAGAFFIVPMFFGMHPHPNFRLFFSRLGGGVALHLRVVVLLSPASPSSPFPARGRGRGMGREAATVKCGATGGGRGGTLGDRGNLYIHPKNGCDFVYFDRAMGTYTGYLDTRWRVNIINLTNDTPGDK